MATNIWFWVIFNAFVVGMLALDLGVFNRKAHRVGVKEAAIWSVVWISLALLFNTLLYFWQGQRVALEFLGGYLLEKSLSVDNIFVFVMIFGYFATPGQYQHRVLYWGILTALVLRGAMILAGAALLTRFEFLIGVFGLLLIVTAIRMAKNDDNEMDLEQNWVVRTVRRYLPVTSEYHGQHFTVLQNGVRMITPLLLVLLVVETSDVIFAIDSIPAVFGITRDPFIVYTSNVFAILGLRSLYFLLAGVVDKFHYLKLGLAIVLGFVGIKMVVESGSTYVMEHAIHVPIQWSLAVIFTVLAASIVASLIFPPPVAEMVEASKLTPEQLRRAQEEMQG
jgi:tellurite resistance protein TerC